VRRTWVAVLALLVAGCAEHPSVEPVEVGSPLPELTLPSLASNEEVSVADLRGPLVMNLWASWCVPCREELPELQRYADAGDVAVIGVATEDRRSAATALAQDLGLRFLSLEDQEGRLKSALGAPGLPVTVLVDAGGMVRYVHLEPGLDEPALAALVEEHLGAG
jgi:thiol-disulfide isomerase/thioredoxin